MGGTPISNILYMLSTNLCISSELLKLLEIEGCIVTIDTMGCQKNIAKTIVSKSADYVFSLKGNQGNLHENIKLFFQSHFKENFKDLSFNYHGILLAKILT